MARALVRAALSFVLLAMPATANAQEIDWSVADTELQGEAARCVDRVDPGERPAAILPRREALSLMSRMLRIDPAQCPGAPEQAAAAARRLLGNPEAADADPNLLRLVHFAAENGKGMARDTVLADRIGRLMWLYEDFSPPRWPEAERRAWVERPATIALLDARVAQRGRELRTHVAVRRLAALKLRRDLPAYDPRTAIDLLDEDSLLIGDEHRIAFSRLVTSGEHVPADFARARRALILFGSMGEQATTHLQAELLRVGRLAARQARTPAQRAEALRILSAAAIDGGAAEVAARDRLIGQLGRVPTERLAPEDAARIGRDMIQPFFVRLGYRREGDPHMLSPIRLRGLIAPDGRIAHVEVLGSSGLRRKDRGILAAWAEEGRRADLSATARGRFVWVELPPVDPELRLPGH